MYTKTYCSNYIIYLFIPLMILQKRAMCTTTFSQPDEHSEPLFKELEILK